MPVIAALDAKTDLALPAAGGSINEDVMQKIWDVSRIPLPFTDVVGTGSVSAAQYDWMIDKLAAAAANKWVETADFSTGAASGVVSYADSATVATARLRNHIQISVKAVSVSEMANAVDSVGGSGGLSYNLMVAQQELKRDMEFHMVGNYASDAGNGTTTAPVTASYIAGCKDQTVPTRLLFESTTASTPSTQGGWDGTSIFDAATINAGKAALQEADLRNAAQALYEGGCGGPDTSLVLMTAPSVKRKISEYMYTSSARIAQLVKDVGSATSATAAGNVEIFITDFGILTLHSNRFMADLGTNQYAVHIFDPAYYEQVFLKGVSTTVNAKIGLVDRRTMSAYWGTRFNPECMATIVDVDNTLAVTA